MSVMVAEQSAATAAEAGAAEASSGASQAVASRTGGRTQQGRASRSSARGGRRPAPQTASTRQGGTQRKARGPKVPKAVAAGQDRTSYQAVVLAEFVAAVLLVASTPFATKKSQGVSPYEGSDLVSLVALGLTYFLLALVSGISEGWGRFAAWFGALILLTVGLGQAARMAKLFNAFGLTSKASGASGASGAGAQDQATEDASAS